MLKPFVIDGQAQNLPSTPITIAGVGYDVPVMNLDTYLFCLENVAPALSGASQAEKNRKYIEALAYRMASVDGSKLTVDFITKYTAGAEEVGNLFAAISTWMIDSGFLVKPGEQKPGAESLQPPAT